MAALCKDRMHLLMEEALMRVGQAGAGSSSRREPAAEGLYRAAMRRCFERMDQVALSTCACGSIGYLCGCHPMEVALSGSTAVVALVTANHIVVANCGDSRAVLCRGGRAVPLSEDHKVMGKILRFYCMYTRGVRRTRVLNLASFEVTAHHLIITVVKKSRGVGGYKEGPQTSNRRFYSGAALI